MLRNTIRIILVLFFVIPTIQAQPATTKKYVATTVPGDPLKAQIYTLDNGLKVYLSVYKDEPRFFSMIGVKAGSKNDPADHTGLAHYLEHMLFKGTDKYGVLDNSKEAPLLDSISKLYEVYGATTDTAKRTLIYHQIDSVSGVASKYAIGNELDKMMAGLGVTGVNAYTSVEQTVYINNVPSNAIDPFLTIEAERFRQLKLRLFHTELEAVYEEKNRGLDNDGRKMWEALYAGLFPNHPYGTQTTIGTVEHLKSPSLVAIQKYFDAYYVPNNMIISISGDINPDATIRLIDEKFGSLKAKDIPSFVVPQEKLIKMPIEKEVLGPDAESMMMGFRFRGANSPDADLLLVVDYILANGQAGLLDLNLNNQQKVLSAGSSTDIMKDYSVHILSGKPREGQTLEQVRDLLNQQIMEIKLGNFPDWLIPAIINNMKKDRAQQYESNQARASAMLSTEILGLDYKTEVNDLDRLSKINKQQVIDFVRTYYGDNYVIVYKRKGVDESVTKVTKPSITPVETNRESESPFVTSVLTKKLPVIQPSFIDFDKAITSGKVKTTIPFYMVKNKENNLFDLTFTFPMGTNNNKQLSMALAYFDYLGTDKYTSTQLKESFYKLACSYSAGVVEDEAFINLSGIQENFIPALQLLEEALTTPKADAEALENLKDDVMKKRQNAKLNKNIILGAMQQYVKFGPKSPQTNVLSADEIAALKADELVSTIKGIIGYAHRIDYYGPMDSTLVVNALNKFHKAPKLLQNPPSSTKYVEQSTDTGKVYIVNYDMKQAEILFLAKGMKYDLKTLPTINMYNRYFGGGMSSPVFQTMRESKALAYSVSSRYTAPSILERSYYNFAYIGTQADKLPEAVEGMMELLKVFPMSEKGYAQAKEGAMQQIQTDRITKGDILNTYHRNKKLGVNVDTRKVIYDALPSISLNDLKSFHEQYLKNLTYQFMVLGNKEKLNLDPMKKYGEISTLELKDVFGY